MCTAGMAASTRRFEPGKPTVSTDQFATPSGAAACVARLPAGGRVGVEWGDSSHRLVRRKVAQTKTWRHYVMCTAGMAASTRRFELGETHGSTDQFATPSGAAACVARLPAGGRVGVEWGDSSHRLVRRKVLKRRRGVIGYVYCGHGREHTAV